MIGKTLLRNFGGRMFNNLQKREYRVAGKDTLHPGVIETVTTSITGNEGTKEWRMRFQTSLDGHKQISPWHDIPLGFYVKNNELLFNYVNEIPKGDRAKMETAVGEEWNPIKQDIKKGDLRFFKYGDLPFNYGFIPQTWEDPDEQSNHVDIKGLGGDNDPVDVVEISNERLPRGIVTPIKVIGVLGLIDENETDWKVIGIRANHPLASKLNTMQDVRNHFQERLNIDQVIVDWFRNYKVPDGKNVNSFSHNAQYQSPEMTVHVIEETHRQWYNLMLKGVSGPKTNLKSITHDYLTAQKIIGNKTIGKTSPVEYHQYENWSPKKINIESCGQEKKCN